MAQGTESDPQNSVYLAHIGIISPNLNIAVIHILAWSKICSKEESSTEIQEVNWKTWLETKSAQYVKEATWIIVSQAYPCYTTTWWQAASSTDTRLFPLPVLARARQGPAEGQTGFESTNGVGGNGREGMKEAWETDNRGLCVGKTVTSGPTERGSMVHKEAETKSNVRQKSAEEC